MEKIKFRDDGLPDLGQENWDLVCSNCGGKWGYDHTSGDGICLDPITGKAKSTKFQLVDKARILGVKKRYIKECPCGIWHGDCDYHK